MKGTLERMAMVLAAVALFGCDEEAKGDVSPDPATEGAGDEAQPAASATAEEGDGTERAQEPGSAEPSEKAPPAKAKVGETAPDFTLTDQAGEQHTLSDYRGKIVVLEWLNPECPYVQRHYDKETMTGLDESFPDDKVKWLAIDSSHFVKPEESQKWRKKHGIEYPVLQDPEGEVGRKYEAKTTPHMFVIDRKGKLRYAGGIDDDPRGRKDEPTNYVRGAVQALLDGEDPPASTSEPYGCTVKYESS